MEYVRPSGSFIPRMNYNTAKSRRHRYYFPSRLLPRASQLFLGKLLAGAVFKNISSRWNAAAIVVGGGRSMIA
jgi:hypothetical protein